MRLSFVALPFFYGWFIVAVAFVTMGIGVNARTRCSWSCASIRRPRSSI